MTKQATPGWNWLIEKEGFVLALITVAAYIYAANLNNGYLATLGLGSTGTISLSGYMITFTWAMGFFLMYYAVIQFAFNRIIPKFWPVLLSSTGGLIIMIPIALVFPLIFRQLDDSGHVSTVFAVRCSLGSTVAATLMLIWRAYIFVNMKVFAPCTFVAVFFFIGLVGSYVGKHTALARDTWRMLTIEGDPNTYVILNERDAQFVVAVLEKGDPNTYERAFLYFDRSTEGARESIREIGVIRLEK